MMHRRFLLACVLAVLFIPAFADSASAQPDCRANSDNCLLGIQSAVNEFGGSYVDAEPETGKIEKLHIWLTEPSEEAEMAAKQRLEALYDIDVSGDRVVVHRADYSFRQLDEWQEAAGSVLNLPGVTATDVDERTNRVTVGVEDPGQDSAAVTRELTRLGIPLAAAEIVQMGVFVPLPDKTAYTGLVLPGMALMILFASLIRCVRRRREAGARAPHRWLAGLVGLAMLLQGCGEAEPVSRELTNTTAQLRRLGTSPAIAAAEPCMADHLRATLAGEDGGGGHKAAALVVYNVSAQPCTASGPGRLLLRQPDGLLLASSSDHRPHMPSGDPLETGPFELGARQASETFGSSTQGKLIIANIAQGTCPGGVFPPGARLFVELPEVGELEVDGFSGRLPFDYRCDQPIDEYPPLTPLPELLIGEFGGTPAGGSGAGKARS